MRALVRRQLRALAAGASLSDLWQWPLLAGTMRIGGLAVGVAAVAALFDALLRAALINALLTSLIVLLCCRTHTSPSPSSG